MLMVEMSTNNTVSVDKMSKSKGSRESKMSRYFKAPIRFLCRARDLYVHRMTSCAGNMSYGGGYTDATGLSHSTLPKSFSVSSSRSSFSVNDDDLRELMRAASKRTLEDKFGTGTESPLQQLFSPTVPPKGMGTIPRARSHSVGISRIDEEMPCDFAEDNTTDFLYPRSRSCATVTKRPAPSRHY
ncbi:uncharacterized protein LOC122083334 [Macadamia integrifolia]|uniref:uncharacterized protein LOC122083334 n=1 Tax=Macadamia integrifolia TaxID=60698 RepID=UPI001C4FD3B4|nr:uncharacterized protein LOC122083334 [Macadamia integrifolia]